MIPGHPTKTIRFHTFAALVLVVFAIPSHSQHLNIEWDRTYGGNHFEEMNTAIETTDGYIFGGITTTQNASGEVTQLTKDTMTWPDPFGDYWVIKTDKQGNPLWDKVVGGFTRDQLWSIVETPDGGYLLGGKSLSGTGADRTQPNRGDYDYWVVKLDASGNKVWDRAYGGTGYDELRKIVKLPNGQYLLAGNSNSPASFEKSMPNLNGSMDFWLVRIDENGNPLGDYTFGGSEHEELYDAILTHDQNILLAGASVSPPSFNKTTPLYGLNDIWLVKVSSTGGFVWDAGYGGNGQDVPQRVHTSLDGNYYVIGQSTSDKLTGTKTSNNYGLDDLWLIKFADLGSSVGKVWEVAYGGSASDYGYAVLESAFGNMTIFGESASPPDSLTMSKTGLLLGGKDYWVLHLNADGSKIWDETVGGLRDDGGRFVFSAHDYGFVLAGLSMSDAFQPYKSENNRGPEWSNDLWVVRTYCTFPPPAMPDLPKACLDEELILDATISVPCPNCAYYWSDGTAGPLRTVSPDSTTTFEVTVVHPDGCEFSDTVVVEILPAPTGFVPAGSPITCYGLADASLLIDSVLGGTPPYLFSFEDGAWAPTLAEGNLGPGTYHLEVLDSNDCLLDTSVFIAQPEEVLVDVGEDLHLDYGDSIQLQALTNLLDSFTIDWGQPSFLSCADCLEPWAKPNATTVVSVSVSNQNGCTAEDHLTIIVQRSDAVFIPNAFSPNLDNLNDFLTVYADRSVQLVKSFRVFDRWGEPVFERYNFPPNVEYLGWDGRLQARPLDPAVFSYFAEVVFFDGRVELLEGDVTLLR